MTDVNDAFTVGERYRPTAINNVRSKYVVYVNSRCARTVPSALADVLVRWACRNTCQPSGAVESAMLNNYRTDGRKYSGCGCWIGQPSPIPSHWTHSCCIGQSCTQTRHAHLGQCAQAEKGQLLRAVRAARNVQCPMLQIKDVHGIGNPNWNGNPMGIGQELKLKLGNGDKNGNQPGWEWKWPLFPWELIPIYGCGKLL